MEIDGGKLLFGILVFWMLQNFADLVFEDGYNQGHNTCISNIW